MNSIELSCIAKCDWIMFFFIILIISFFMFWYHVSFLCGRFFNIYNKSVAKKWTALWSKSSSWRVDAENKIITTSINFKINYGFIIHVVAERMSTNFFFYIFIDTILVHTNFLGFLNFIRLVETKHFNFYTISSWIASVIVFDTTKKANKLSVCDQDTYLIWDFFGLLLYGLWLSTVDLFT